MTMIDEKLATEVLRSYRRSKGNLADNLREMDVEDLQQRYGCNEATAKEIKRRMAET